MVNAIYAKIIAEIDNAILKYAGRPVSLSIDGQSATYDLPALWDLRAHYAKLKDQSGGGRAFQLNHLQSGGGF